MIAPNESARPPANADDADDDATTAAAPPAAAGGSAATAPAPTAHRSGGGCSLAPGRRRAHAVRWLALVGVWALARRRRRRHRIDRSGALRCE
jgi:hypothetical protein